MIDFRYHVVSIVAVFLALALGLFLGSTTLQGAVFNNLNSRVTHVTENNSMLSSRNHLLGNELGNQQSFERALAQYAVLSRLAGDAVAVVAAPGVPGSVPQQVDAMLEAADATVAAQVQLLPAFFDPSQETLLASLANRLRPAGVNLPAGSGAVRAAAEIAAALGSRPGRIALTAVKEQGVLSSYADARLLNLSGTVHDIHPAELTVLLVPSPAGMPDAADIATDDTTLQDFALDLARSSAGTVLAGPLTSATASNGVLNSVRALPSSQRASNLSTVDSDDMAAGQITVVFALIEVFDGRGGDFGQGSGANLLPSPTASP